MKIRSTVFWPEQNVAANEIVDLPDAEAQARIDEGFAAPHIDEPAPAIDEPMTAA